MAKANGVVLVEQRGLANAQGEDVEGAVPSEAGQIRMAPREPQGYAVDLLGNAEE